MVNKKFESLKKKSDFQDIKNAGKRFRLDSWLLFNFRKNGTTTIRIGMTIPKKVGVAVIRNKLKRWCRECLRKEMQPDMPGADINVVFFGKSKEFYKELRFEDFRNVFIQGIERIRKTL